MLKSGSDMMAAAERKLHSFEEFEALKGDGKISDMQPKKQHNNPQSKTHASTWA